MNIRVVLSDGQDYGCSLTHRLYYWHVLHTHFGFTQSWLASRYHWCRCCHHWLLAAAAAVIAAELDLAAVAVRLPVGSRLRLALSPYSWPMSWPLAVTTNQPQSATHCLALPRVCSFDTADACGIQPPTRVHVNRDDWGFIWKLYSQHDASVHYARRNITRGSR